METGDGNIQTFLNFFWKPCRITWWQMLCVLRGNVFDYFLWLVNRIALQPKACVKSRTWGRAPPQTCRPWTSSAQSGTRGPAPVFRVTPPLAPRCEVLAGIGRKTDRRAPWMPAVISSVASPVVTQWVPFKWLPPSLAHDNPQSGASLLSTTPT